MIVKLKNKFYLPIFNFMLPVWILGFMFMTYKSWPLSNLIASDEMTAYVFVAFFTIAIALFGTWLVMNSASNVTLTNKSLNWTRSIFGFKNEFSLDLKQISKVEIYGNISMGHVLRIYSTNHKVYKIHISGLVVIEGTLDDVKLNQYAPLNPGQCLAHQFAQKIALLTNTSFYSEFINRN